MKVYFSRYPGEYGKNRKSGTQSFIDKFYQFMYKAGHQIIHNFNEKFDIHFVLCSDGNVHISNSKGIPVVTRLDGMYSPACDENYESMNFTMIDTVKKSDYVIFQNKFCKEIFEHFAGFVPKNYTYILNGCDINIFKQPEKKIFKNNILFFGQIRRKDVVITNVEAIDLIRKEIPDAELWLVGGIDGNIGDVIPDKPYIKKFGSIENFELPKYAKDCSVFGITTPKVAEHNAVSEVMACGLPVVCYDDGGCHYKVKDAGIILKADYYGWDRFTHNDPQKYADAIIKVLKNKEEYYKKACARREDLSMEVMAKKYIKIFEDVINGNKKV